METGPKNGPVIYNIVSMQVFGILISVVDRRYKGGASIVHDFGEVNGIAHILLTIYTEAGGSYI